VTYLRNPKNHSPEVSILPEENDTKEQVLALARQFSGTIWVYEDIYVGKRTLNEVVIRLH